MKNEVQLTDDQVRELLQAGLQALYGSYQQGEVAARANGEAASDQELKRKLQTGIRETEEQAKRLLVVFDAMNLAPNATHDLAVQAILEQSRTTVNIAPDALSRDLSIIAAERLTAHVAIAALGTLHTYARLLKNTIAARHLHRMMNDTKQLDEAVTKLALRLVKESAARQQGAAALEHEEEAS